MRRIKAQSSSTTDRCIHRGNRYAENIHSTRPPSREEDTLDTKSYIRNEGPLKGQVYKPRDLSPLNS